MRGDESVSKKRNLIKTIQGSGSFPHEVLVKTDPNVATNLRQAVADKLNAIGYYWIIPQNQLHAPVDPNQIIFGGVEYSTICSKP